MFLKAKEDLKGLSADLCKDMGLSDGDSDDENSTPMTEWPEFFEVEDVPPVRKTDLWQKPRMKDFKSMENML